MTSLRRKLPKTNAQAIEAVDRLLNRPTQSNQSDLFSINGSDITISHLAGSIERKAGLIRTNCENCELIIQNIFKENLKLDHAHVQTKNSPIPCYSTFTICSIANEYLRIHAFKIDFNYNRLLSDILQNIEMEMLYEETDFSHELQHKSDLIKFIIDEFIRCRATYIAQKITLHEKQKFLRRKIRKLIHFAGE